MFCSSEYITTCYYKTNDCRIFQAENVSVIRCGRRLMARQSDGCFTNLLIYSAFRILVACGPLGNRDFNSFRLNCSVVRLKDESIMTAFIVSDWGDEM